MGLIVAFLATTGSIMAFQDGVIAFAERRVQVQPARETRCISVEAGLEAIRTQTGRTPATLLLARHDGHEVRWTEFLMQSRAQRWRTEVKYLHTGEIFGLGGQIVVFLAVMAALVQVVSGFGMAWKRWRARRERQARIAYVQAEPGFSAPGNLRREGRQAREETYGGR